ncbi:MAG TPA: DUF3182 family protein [Burkholderiales bacterium]|nr:DUF3182 family protein [Burkholderiales bacterium]
MVVTYGPKFADPGSHEAQTLTEVARSIARLLDQEFGGVYNPALIDGIPPYFVPGHTLVGNELGIEREDEFFGGVVPFPFVAHKTIAHPLLGTRAPEGWSHALAARMRDAVLPGFSAFTMEDAREAATRMLGGGTVRLKPAMGIGSRGQYVVEDAAQLDQVLKDIDASEGLVVERNLVDVTTYSVGQVSVGVLRAAYIGTQSLTRDNEGNNAYGGSEIIVVRGGYDALSALKLPAELSKAVRQAQAFEVAATSVFPSLIASRRNYDVACGRDSAGEAHCGVLEQSWRIGGASPAEVAALEVLRDDPDLSVVHASTVERYGPDVEVPDDARLLFSGNGLTKYVVVHED